MLSVKQRQQVPFFVFGMTRPGIEPRSPAQTTGEYIYIYIYIELGKAVLNLEFPLKNLVCPSINP